MEFLILIVAVLIGFYMGWEARERYAMRVVNELLKYAEEQEEDDDENKPERMCLERHGEVIYAYTDKHEFIGQGNTLVELDDAIQKRFPGRKFLIKKENLEEVGAAHEYL